MKNKNTANISDFHSSGNAGIHQEIAQYLREKIESGVLAPGERLPPLRELAKCCQTNYFSVKVATDLLVDFGLLNKQHGRGMFVAPRGNDIRRVGIYTSKIFNRKTDLTAFSVLRDLLIEGFQARGITCMIFDDCRPAEQHHQAPDELQQAIISGQIQAVVGVIVRKIDNEWFDRLPIRKATMMHDPQCDFQAIARLLNERGCQRVAGIISGGPIAKKSFLLAGLHEAGIKIKPRYLKVIHEENYQQSWGEIGYRCTMELLNCPQRPDALIVYPDNAVMGAMQAIIRLGIQVPEKLFVIFHRNLELSYFCSFDAAYMDTKISAIADQLIDSIIK